MAKWRTTPYHRYCGDADATRDDYLRELADDYGVPRELVKRMADQLGESEDFDGLVIEVHRASVAYLAMGL